MHCPHASLLMYVGMAYCPVWEGLCGHCSDWLWEDPGGEWELCLCAPSHVNLQCVVVCSSLCLPNAVHPAWLYPPTEPAQAQEGRRSHSRFTSVTCCTLIYTVVCDVYVRTVATVCVWRSPVAPCPGPDTRAGPAGGGSVQHLWQALWNTHLLCVWRGLEGTPDQRAGERWGGSYIVWQVAVWCGHSWVGHQVHCSMLMHL